MKFEFNMPVNLKFGTGVIRKNSEDFKLGKKALLVTGKSSAHLSGALDDILYVLDEQNIGYEIFDRVEINPSLQNVADGAELCRETGADFIIAIGGGSPMDAAKGIAALAANDMEPIELLNNKFVNPFLPIIAVPTTSGTGSEVTPYSVLTIPSMKTKRSFTSKWSFPVFAFADPEYTKSLPLSITIDTAFDAFSHLLESYCSRRSTPFNDVIALEGIAAFEKCMDNIESGNITDETRKRLMYASCLGGMAITHTGTTLMHAMGYSLTYFKNYSHGRANALLIGEYLKLVRKEIPEKVATVLSVLGLNDYDEADNYFALGMGEYPVLTDDECKQFASLAATQGSVRQTRADISEKDIYDLYKQKFGGGQ